MKHFLPDPADLRWLVRSLDLNSFSAAARELDVAVSVVTRGVNRLETGYGVTLLRRSTHGLSATAEGFELAQEARELLARMEDISAAVSKQRNRVAGALRLASSQEICEELVVPQLGALRARYPELRIEVALRTTVGNSEAVVARALGSFERRLYASPEYLRQHGEPAGPDELGRHQTVTHTAQGPVVTWAFRKAGRSVEATVRSQLAMNTTALVHHALVAGAGIGMLSVPLAAGDVAKGLLKEVLSPYASGITHTMFAVSLPNLRNAARVRAVIDFLQAAARRQWAMTCT